ncbi:hypothetical protein [uncultured Bosea sp.]|uniref:hypothetical protein n=1 Tax=uncultured Bosea sp. TaxID=211457 RepID=UPI002601367C|nr:hypothetical protein [uncultured Bosea sp.]
MWAPVTPILLRAESSCLLAGVTAPDACMFSIAMIVPLIVRDVMVGAGLPRFFGWLRGLRVAVALEVVVSVLSFRLPLVSFEWLWNIWFR